MLIAMISPRLKNATDYLSQAEAANICSEKPESQFSDCFYEVVEGTRALNADSQREISNRYLFLGRDRTHANRHLPAGLAFILCENTDQIAENEIAACSEVLEPFFRVQLFNYVTDASEEESSQELYGDRPRWPRGYYPVDDKSCRILDRKSNKQVCACQIKTDKKTDEDYYADCSFF